MKRPFHVKLLPAIGLMSVFLLPTAVSGSVAEHGRGSIFGVVRDLRGNTLPDAQLTLYAYAAPMGHERVEVKKLSVQNADSAGRYRFGDVSPGTYMVRAWSEGFASAEVWNVYVGPGEARLLDLAAPLGYITPGPPTSVSGEVRGPDGSRLSEATITIRDAFNAGVLVQTRSDRNGRFNVSLVYCGQYLISTFKPGFDLAATVVGIACGRENSVDLVLRESSH